MSKLFNCSRLLFNVVWNFLLTVWTTVRLCAELITRHTKSQTHLKLGEVSSRRSYPQSSASPFFFSRNNISIFGLKNFFIFTKILAMKKRWNIPITLTYFNCKSFNKFSHKKFLFIQKQNLVYFIRKLDYPFHSYLFCSYQKTTRYAGDLQIFIFSKKWFSFHFFIIIYGFFTNHAVNIDLKFRYFVDLIFPIFQCFPCWSRI
jgi:hypothetical protein